MWGSWCAPHVGSTPADDDSPPFFSPMRDDLSWLLLQVIVILTVSAIVSRVLDRLQVPSAVSQIITGIILGPTVMGYIPNFTDDLFPEGELGALDTIGKFGLIWFMFLIGLELDKEVLRSQFKSCLIVSISGVAVPLAIGAGVAQYLIYYSYIEPDVSYLHFSLFIAVAMAITAFPVLARIISERGLLETSLGVLVLGSAAVDDLLGWIILAINIALVRAGTGLNGLYVCLVMLAFILCQAYAVGPLFKFICKYFHDPRKDLSDTSFLLIILFVLLSAWLTEGIGVEGIFGAFVFGTVVPREGGINVIVAHKFEEFVVAVFLPLYFALSGLKTQLALISTPLDWGSCILVTTLAFVGKIVPGYVAARYCGRTHKEGLVVGCLRNAKGLVEIVVLNLGLANNVLNKQVFGMFVVMAVVTTVCAVPLVMVIHPPKAILEDERSRRSLPGPMGGGVTGAGVGVIKEGGLMGAAAVRLYGSNSSAVLPIPPLTYPLGSAGIATGSVGSSSILKNGVDGIAGGGLLGSIEGGRSEVADSLNVMYSSREEALPLLGNTRLS